jgi:hypothetical protein
MAGVVREVAPAMFLTPESQIGAAIMVAVCLFVAWTGGRPQRVTAALVAFAWIASAGLQDRRYINPQYGWFVIDLAAMVAFAGLALRWRQTWQIWVAAFQTLTMGTHVAVLIDLRIWPLAYITAYLVWSYALLAALAWGGVEGLRERGRGPPTGP